MNQINELPTPNDVGLDFNYANWSANTRLTMVNVPWNNDYRDIVKFANRAALNTYINSRESTGIVINNASYIKPNQPIRIDTPFNSAIRFNYLRASNPLMPIDSDIQRDYFYFITGVTYIAPETTEVTLQLDIWQTFGFDITFGNSYIERGHIGIANTHAFDNYGRDWLTTPEGVDFGGEYRIVDRKHESIINNKFLTLGDGKIPELDANILAISTIDLTADAGTVDAPTLVTAEGANFEGLASGASYYVWEDVARFSTWMINNKNKPWVTQGIISVTVIPKLSRYFPGFEIPDDTAVNAYQVGIYYPGVVKHSIYTNWRDTLINKIPSRYRHLKKFLTYPYMVIEMTTWTGTPILLKPESWNDANAKIIERATFTAPNQRVEFFPFKYNAETGSDTDNLGHHSDSDINDSEFVTEIGRIHGDWIDAGDDSGDYLDLVTKVAQFPTMAVVNNGAIGYLASNMNSIAYQHSSADWSQSRALRGNQVSYDQQTAGIATSKGINELERAGMGGTVASNQQAMLEGVAANGLFGAATGIAGAGLQGGPGGALNGVGAVGSQIMGGVNAGIAINQQNRNLANAQSVSKGSNAAQNNQAALLRDTNKGLADWSARGDYENTIAGINAKVQDAKLIQPTTSGQMGGETINMVYDNMEVSLRWKLIDNAAIRNVGEYWLRYGYAVRKFAIIPASLMVMTKFTYWKLAETYIISAPMPEFFKQAIRGIFEKGVTVWASPADIGNIDIADNTAIGGISL